MRTKLWLVVGAIFLSGCETVTGSVTPTVTTTPSPKPTPWVFDASKVTYNFPPATPTPAPYTPSVPPPCSKNVIVMQATVSMAKGVLTIKVVDQARRPVTCAWVMPVSGGGLEGATGADGTLSAALADMPAHFHSVSQALLGDASTAFAYGR